MRRFAALGSLLVVVLGLGLVTGCMADPLPEPTVRAFLLAWQAGDYTAAARQTTGDPKTVARALAAAHDQLDAAAIRFQLRPLRQHGDTATAGFHATVDLDENGFPWEYDGRLDLRRVDGEWKIVWSPSVIHPRLGPGQRFAVLSTVPERAEVLDAAGRPLVAQTPIAVVGVVPARLTDPAATTRQLAKLTGLDPDRLLGRVLAAPPQRFVSLVTLRMTTYRRQARQFHAIPGLEFHLGRAPYTPLRAAGLVGRVGTATRETTLRIGTPYQPGDSVGLTGLQLAFQRRLAGTPTTEVVTLDPDGRVAAVLATWPGTPSASVRTTIDSRVQAAAETSLRLLQHPGSLVAVSASTGRILAVAERPADGGRALAGRYPPGEAFTIVSTAALLRGGLQADRVIPCAPQRHIGGKAFRTGSPLAQSPVAPPFREDFALSCSTAFVGLSRGLSADVLGQTAGQFGLGTSWMLPGVASFPGSVPRSGDAAAKAAWTIGEGGVTASPLAMALVAGAVDAGSWRPPVLVTDPPESTHLAAPIRIVPDTLGQLREMMRATVLTGTATGVNLPGPPVYGQTGAAPYGHHEVVWFVGYRGDIAFAVAAEVPSGAANIAVPVAADFLRSLPGPASPGPKNNPGTRATRSRGGGVF